MECGEEGDTWLLYSTSLPPRPGSIWPRGFWEGTHLPQPQRLLLRVLGETPPWAPMGSSLSPTGPAELWPPEESALWGAPRASSPCPVSSATVRLRYLRGEVP